MKNKLVKKWIALCLCSVVLAGCGSEVSNGGQTTNQTQESQSSTGSNAGAESVEFEKVELEGKYERAAYFADMVYETNGSSNVMVSPLSLDMALGLLSGGAKGQTKDELSNYLGTEDYGNFVEEYMEYAEGLNSKGDSDERYGYKLAYEIANSIWVKDDRKLVDSYVKTAEDQYDAEIEAVSFKTKDLPETVEKINSWCNEKTHELIPKIVSEQSFSEDAAAVLINSIYFESPWREEWSVTTHTFTDFEGNTTEQEMLRDTLTTYYENDHATGFAKSYRNGMQFIGILPKETGEFTLSDLDVESLLESETTEYDVRARMPRLNFDTTADNVVEILQYQGVETVFDDEKADLTGLIEMEGDEVSYVSSIIQKTKLELDENGTKAAAVTAVMVDMATSAMPEEREEKEVFLDRPFAFMIYDETNDQIVFMGKVVTP